MWLTDVAPNKSLMKCIQNQVFFPEVKIFIYLKVYNDLYLKNKKTKT